MTTLDDAVTRLLIPLIRDIIGEKKLGCKEVRQALNARGKDASESTISKFAFAMGLTPAKGRRKGTKIDPSVRRSTGRPRGQGERHVAYRERARELKAQYPGYSNQELADMMTQESSERGDLRSFSREAIRLFLLTDDN